MKRSLLFLAVVALIGFGISGCKKSVEPEDTSYKCNCGSFSWQGQNYPLYDASRIQWDDTLYYTREYYGTAEMRNGNQFLEPNSLNLEMSFEDITQLIFFAEVDTFDVLLQEINYNDPLNTIREFVPDQGSISITPSLPGSPEVMSFNFSMRQIVNGQLVGLPVPFSGTMVVE